MYLLQYKTWLHHPYIIFIISYDIADIHLFTKHQNQDAIHRDIYYDTKTNPIEVMLMNRKLKLQWQNNV